MSGNGGGRDDGFASSSQAGGSASGAGEGGDPGAADSCDIMQRAPLNSPQPAVVSKLVVGDILAVVLNTTGPRPVLEAHSRGRGLAGAFTHRGHLNVIRCIQAGHSYRAVVLQVAGGSVDVRIEPR